ncbi:MAG: hypothetical protein PHC68_00555 [Syntrophorhabdaceae bacterium]|nr:hypothetical protein [Syntrophorhabdaceae bacterium]
MNFLEFKNGMKKYFGIKFGVMNYVDQLCSQPSSIKLNVVEFDDKFLHTKFGNYELKHISMSDIVKKHFGKEAETFLRSLL